jgi:hypothetical protein
MIHTQDRFIILIPSPFILFALSGLKIPIIILGNLYILTIIVGINQSFVNALGQIILARGREELISALFTRETSFEFWQSESFGNRLKWVNPEGWTPTEIDFKIWWL